MYVDKLNLYSELNPMYLDLIRDGKIIFAFTEKIFREINSLASSLVKILLSRNFCEKSVRAKSKFP